MCSTLIGLEDKFWPKHLIYGNIRMQMCEDTPGCMEVQMSQAAEAAHICALVGTHR